MFSQLSDEAKNLWEEWNIRSFVLISLLFQVVLIFSASSRKTTKATAALIWFFYLLADAIAMYSVGLISNGLSNDRHGKSSVNMQLAAFWAPFLLLHLGGPDDITAFSLEDNQLWIRHFLGFVIQVSAVVYIFVQSFPNQFMIPTILVFLVGTCKYLERTRALYKACLNNFKSSGNTISPDASYVPLMEEYSVMESLGFSVSIEIADEPKMATAEPNYIPDLDERLIVILGYQFFTFFKELIVDAMFGFNLRSSSRGFFLKQHYIQAFQVLEVELNFLYDALYTKMPVVHNKIGYFLRFLCAALLVACFQQFTRLQHKIPSVRDIIVTYVLLGGAIFLDLVAFVKLVISDWAIVSARNGISTFLVNKRWRRNHRWSNTISQHSFISFIAREEPFWISWLNKLAFYLGIKEALEELLYTKPSPCNDNLKKLIFQELTIKAKDVKTTKDAKVIFASRGDRALQDYKDLCSNHPSISQSVSPDKHDYDESLILWHIATEMCYFNDSGNDNNAKGYCKVISDYMFYLLFMRPRLISTVASMAQSHFQDTCDEAREFLHRCKSKWDTSSNRQTALMRDLLNVETVLALNDVKGNQSKGLVFNARILANDLNKIPADNKWKMMSRVWVELLSYAAGHCRPDAHAQQLSQGGELITFVWLLMAHLGLGEQFRVEKEPRSILLVTE